MKNQYLYLLKKDTTPEQAKIELEKLESSINKKDLFTDSNFMTFGGALIVLGMIVLSACYIYFSIALDPQYILDYKNAVELKDTFALSRASSEFRGIDFLLFVTALILVVLYYTYEENVSENRLEYVKAVRYLRLRARGKGRKVIEENLGMIKLEIDDIRSTLRKIVIALIAFVSLFVTSLYSGYSGYVSVEDVKIEQEITSLHYLDGEYTVFYRKGNKLSKLEIPQDINLDITFNDSLDKPEFKAHYRLHLSKIYEAPLIVSEKNRSIEYKAQIEIPKDFVIEGSRKY